MKVKALSVFTMVMIGSVGGEAEAMFLGLSLDLHAVTTADQTGGLIQNVWRAYAHFSDPADRLTAVFGNQPSPFTLTASGVFFNVPIGGNAPLNASQLISAPNAVWDTSVIIGLAAGHSGPAGANVNFTPGFPLIAGSGVVGHTNMAWATFGVLPQSAPDPQGRVLIMQLTTGVGETVFGSMGINWRNASGTVVQSLNQQFIPSAGGFMLLGFAGLAASRRRRI